MSARDDSLVFYADQFTLWAASGKEPELVEKWLLDANHPLLDKGLFPGDEPHYLSRLVAGQIPLQFWVKRAAWEYAQAMVERDEQTSEAA